eukprot:1156959-Pelagomonas_calceolata.AAC.7
MGTTKDNESTRVDRLKPGDPASRVKQLYLPAWILPASRPKTYTVSRSACYELLTSCSWFPTKKSNPHCQLEASGSESDCSGSQVSTPCKMETISPFIIHESSGL